MKEKKFILLCNLVNAYKDLSKIFNDLTDTLDSPPVSIGLVCDHLVDMIMDTFGILENNDSREILVDEFYRFANRNDVEDTIQHMLDEIEEEEPLHDFNKLKIK